MGHENKMKADTQYFMNIDSNADKLSFYELNLKLTYYWKWIKKGDYSSIILPKNAGVLSKQDKI